MFVQDTNNWQVSHSWPILNTVVNQFRMGRVAARADQHGIPCPQADVDFLDVTGVFTSIPDDQRECPSIGMQRVRGHGRRDQRLHREQPADVGHQQHDDLGQRAATP